MFGGSKGAIAPGLPLGKSQSCAREQSNGQREGATTKHIIVLKILGN
jgi:hypothetical protein